MPKYEAVYGLREDNYRLRTKKVDAVGSNDAWVRQGVAEAEDVAHQDVKLHKYREVK